jgi:alkylation response protein AidB-like acyl-CoA dehydrogenase
LLSRARVIAEIVRARAQANQRIADDVIERMREAKLFRVLPPAAYGGFDYGLRRLRGIGRHRPGLRLFGLGVWSWRRASMVRGVLSQTGARGILGSRCPRGCRHISLNWDAVSTMYGQYTLGLEPKEE